MTYYSKLIDSLPTSSSIISSTFGYYYIDSFLSDFGSFGNKFKIFTDAAGLTDFGVLFNTFLAVTNLPFFFFNDCKLSVSSTSGGKGNFCDEAVGFL